MKGVGEQGEEFSAGMALRCFGGVGVLDVEAVVVGFECVEGDLPRLVAGLAFTPPFFESVEFGFLDGLGL